MPFVVPALEPHLHAQASFGACKVPADIVDPGHPNVTGVVLLRGLVRADPLYQPPQVGPAGMVPLFTLPAGMRPREARWFTALVSGYLGMADARPVLVIVNPNGRVEVKLGNGSLSVDGGCFFDGIVFAAEQ